MLDENDYLSALIKINHYDFEEKKWLIEYFELFKTTLNWPVGLPPINRTNLFEGTLKIKFNKFYFQLLNEFEYEFDNNKKLLVLLNKKDK